MNWLVRMICPRKGGLGHYDLQLEGEYVLGGATYADPVFSYNLEEGAGVFTLFEGRATAAVYREYLPFELYAYRGTCSSTPDQYRAFLRLIEGSIRADGGRTVELDDSNAGACRRYPLTSAYRIYDRATRNCFTAVALWMEALGDRGLADYARAHEYTDYTAQAMLKNKPELWALVSART